MRTVICEICEKEFQTNSAVKKYCSGECAKIANNSQRKILSRKFPEIKPRKITEIEKAVHKLMKYNKQHGTDYSYGEGVKRGII